MKSTLKSICQFFEINFFSAFGMCLVCEGGSTSSSAEMTAISVKSLQTAKQKGRIFREVKMNAEKTI